MDLERLAKELHSELKEDKNFTEDEGNSSEANNDARA